MTVRAQKQMISLNDTVLKSHEPKEKNTREIFKRF